MALTPAEQLLQELGVTEPGEIDLPTIAFYVGAEVRYRPLDGCEARVFGVGARALITVNERSTYRRKRFSIAHELGHWRHHRGKTLICRADENPAAFDPHSPERVADAYAADLLMPRYLFNPIAVAQAGKLSWKMVKALADVFETSMPATAIRLVELDHTPALLVCHGPNGIKWFRRSRSVPTHWYPQRGLDADSSAFRVLFGKAPDDPHGRKIGADAWFDRRFADRYEMLEQTIRSGPNEVMTLLTIIDDSMLDE